MPVSISIGVVKQYASKHQSMPTKSLARLIIKNEPKLFTSLESCYYAVRRIRGNAGNRNRMTMADKALFKENSIPGEVRIPPGVDEFKPPIQIDGPMKLLILSDMHVPYHDATAIKVAIEHGLKSGCKGVYLNGDSIDFYRLSRFVKDPRMRSPKSEVDTLGEILDELGKHFKQRWYKVGNHDERWIHYLFQQAPELAEFESLELQNILKLKERGYTYVSGRQWAVCGLLPILHGHETVRGFTAPVNPARGLFLRLKQTALVGHHHQPSTHLEPFPLSQEVACSWSTGCLCNLRPAYMPINNWRHGFATVEISSGGEFQLENFQLDKKMKIFRV